jgi:HEAT repeat protein
VTALAIATPLDNRTRYLVRSALSGLGSVYEPKERDILAEWGQYWSNAGTATAGLAANNVVTSGTAVVGNRVIVSINEGANVQTAAGDHTAAAVKANITRTMGSLLRLAKEERFQDGMESNLSQGLAAMIRRYPADAMATLRNIIDSGGVSKSLTAEVIESVSRVNNPESRDARFSLVVSYLRDDSPVVRDAAGTALAYMDDKRAIDYLQSAIEAEPIPTLREDLAQVAEQLRSL